MAISAAEGLKIAAEETRTMLLAIEGARMQISSSADILGEQIRTLKERMRWLTQELELLRKQIGRSTQPGDAR